MNENLTSRADSRISRGIARIGRGSNSDGIRDRMPLEFHTDSTQTARKERETARGRGKQPMQERL